MATLHHLELLVKDGLRFATNLAKQYSMTLSALRETEGACQWVVRTGNAVFVVTEPKDSKIPYSHPQHPALSLQSSKLDQGVGTVFDIAVRVKNINRVLTNCHAIGGEILMPATRTRDEFGICERAVIRSCVGNVVHTLINREDYKGPFLPGFISSTPALENKSSAFSAESLINHVDHITLVCQRGETDNVLSWYEKVFGFSRFFMNKTETETDGFVLQGNIGLRLKAMEYFHCSEMMLTSDLKDENALRIVIAESLPGHDAQSNQVESFIEEHDGPGVQHVGLYTDDIVQAASNARKMGVNLQIPPILYYSHAGKLKEIASSGECVQRLRENGILLDSEADINEGSSKSRRKYLKQIFTKPIFDRNTFFLELIERRGAQGFGTGNIAALWWSVQQTLNLQKAIAT